VPLATPAPLTSGSAAAWAAATGAGASGWGRALLAAAAVLALAGSGFAAWSLWRGLPRPAGTLGAAGVLCGGGGLALTAALGAAGGDPHGNFHLLPLALGVSLAGGLQLVSMLRLACGRDVGEALRRLLDGALIGGSGYLLLWDLAVEPTHRGYSGLPLTVDGALNCGTVAVPSVVALLVLGTSVVVATTPGAARRVLLPASASVGGAAVCGVLAVCAARYAPAALVLLAALAYTGALAGLGRVAPWLHRMPRPVPELRHPPLLVGLAPAILACAVVAARRAFLGPVDRIGLGVLFALTAVVLLRQASTVVLLRRVIALYRHQAQTDPLTGLPNRRRLIELIDHGERPSTLLLIDLDGFKSVNDVRGHDVGDLVLVEVARRLRATVPDSDQVARLGGDEFAGLLHCEPPAALPVAEAVRTALEEPYQVGAGVVYLSASVGVAGRSAEVDASAPGGDGLVRMLADADVALRFAKQRGKNRVESYAVADASWLRRRNRVEQELRGAAGRGELSLVFQPIMELPEGRPVGVETLLRWTHPELGAVAPDEFIPLAEEAGLIGELDRWVLDQACQQAAQWVADGYRPWVAVNISVRDLHQPGYVRRVLQVLRAHELPANLLVLEVTEHAVALDPDEVTQRLTELRELGVRVALDDFGAGYSSLGLLRTLPVDIIKIDRALLVDPLLDISVQLARRLGKLALAEGIGDAAARAAVESTGCPLGQGSALCPPIPAEEVTALLTAPRAVPAQRRAQHAGQVDSRHEMRQS
jgi:diguanylate cyclase